MVKRQAAGVPVGSPMIEVDGVALAVAREGRGPPVLCLSAIAHAAGDFAPLAERLRDRFEVIRIDWPGHGRSGEDHRPLSPARYAEMVAGLMAKLGLERPILIGNSIGAAAAILVARDTPVRALVLCDSGGLVEVNAQVAGITGLFARFFAAGERGAAWFGWAYALYYRLLVLPSAAAAEQRQRNVAAGYELAGKLREAWQGFGRPDADIREIAWSLDVPMWVAWAEQDRVIPLRYCRPAIERMKQASLTVFKGGHAPFLEQPDAFAEGFQAFVGGLKG